MNVFTVVGDILHLFSILVLLLKIYTQKNCKGRHAGIAQRMCVYALRIHCGSALQCATATLSAATRSRALKRIIVHACLTLRFCASLHYALCTGLGISLKTQFLYLLVFVTRYLDLFWNFSSLYNSVMKIIFITSSAAIVYMMRFVSPYKETYDAKSDFFQIPFLLIPSFVLALIWNDYYSFTEILWTFSIYLEAVAIIPQLIVVHHHAKANNGFVENLTSHYVFCLGGYRFLYLINWIYRYATEPDYSNTIVWVAGTVQTLIYCDFFFYYSKAQLSGQKMSLPI
jgi:ER lumen protein retaining receptor